MAFNLENGDLNIIFTICSHQKNINDMSTGSLCY